MILLLPLFRPPPIFRVWELVRWDMVLITAGLLGAPHSLRTNVNSYLDPQLRNKPPSVDPSQDQTARQRTRTKRSPQLLHPRGRTSPNTNANHHTRYLATVENALQIPHRLHPGYIHVFCLRTPLSPLHNHHIGLPRNLRLGRRYLRIGVHGRGHWILRWHSRNREDI